MNRVEAPPLPRPVAVKRRALGRQAERAGWLFVAPAMALFLIFTLIPVLAALGLSLTDYDVFSAPRFLGLENYLRLLGDPTFLTTLRNIGYYVLLFVPATLVLALALASALNRRRPGMTLFRTIYYLPVVTSPVAAATVWIWLLHGQFGALNEALGVVGIRGPAWLANSSTAMLAIVLVTLWQTVGASTIVYLAGLQGIPRQLYEAAALDGASAWQAFRHITIPQLRATTFFVLAISLIGAFQLFDQAYVMTEGGPGQSTLTPVYYIYETGFNRLRMGYASAQAFTLFLVIVAVTVASFRVSRERAEVAV